MLLLIHINRTDSYCYSHSGTAGRSLGRMEWFQPQLQRAGRLSALTVVTLCFALTHSPLCFLCLLHKPFRHLWSEIEPIAVKGRVNLCLRHWCCLEEQEFKSAPISLTMSWGSCKNSTDFWHSLPLSSQRSCHNLAGEGGGMRCCRLPECSSNCWQGHW